MLQDFKEISLGNAWRHNPRAQGWIDRVRGFFGG